MEAKVLKDITSELTLLYVEDDDILRKETSKLFSHLFKSIQTAANGKIALEKYQTTPFDLIVTDINMPMMNGVEFSRNIREIRPDQAIIITSAHDESNYLLELIDIGIDKFIVKPLNIQKFLQALSYVCSNITNEKLVKKYKEELEVSNLKLNQNNTQLQMLVKILDNKILQMNLMNKLIQKIPQQSPKDAINKISSNPPSMQKSLVKESKDIFVYNEYMVQADLILLQKLEVEINSIIDLFNHQDKITHEGVLHLEKSLEKYSNVLATYTLFKPLSKEIQELCNALNNHPNVLVQTYDETCIFLKSFIYVLKKWRTALFDKNLKDPNIYDSSMINDIKAIVVLLRGSNKGSENN